MTVLLYLQLHYMHRGVVYQTGTWSSFNLHTTFHIYPGLQTQAEREIVAARGGGLILSSSRTSAAEVGFVGLQTTSATIFDTSEQFLIL